ncbi:DUF2520 domain-containing protein [Wenzhouxiangella sediminis]|uniref:DUF2520 domain-containing protein n=1 Tax=Wenzhouxiangella sediminis TaxID=1792836 RepID=A0A3E1KCG6_9GAMM|nr:DUF2520 domain-containing protein [Wenzhouxiangella sediminis]RFF31917.1 DUF2520 domain-containing protein [Wenzhouxiangella sediminis]
MNERPALHVLGCGRAARAVARRLLETGLVRPGLIVNRSLSSARRAAEFLGAGEPAERLDERVADGWLMLGLPDGVLADSGGGIGRVCPWAPALVFHLSGSVEAAALEAIGALRAAVHPVRAFADPESAAARFEGTWCVAEGEDAALDLLRPVFEAAGGRWLPFSAGDKSAWHAATVAASNFLVTIQDLARELADRAGLPRAQAAEILCDLQQGALETLRERPPRDALTGPIERGDAGACRRLAAAASGLDPQRARLFHQLARATLELARDKRGERDEDRAIEALFPLTSD